MKIKSPAIIKSGTQIMTINLFDIIDLKKINERKIQINKISGYKIPTNDTNPVYKVASALLLKKPNKLGVIINIQKNIPTFSGLNSQFSNAASVLIALNKLWNFNLNQNELLKISKTVDSKITKILKTHFTVKKIDTKNVILVRPKYIKIDKEWICKQRKKSYQSIILKHFPDIKEIIEILKQDITKACINNTGPIIFGISDQLINIKNIKKLLNNKIDFIWTGENLTI